MKLKYYAMTQLCVCMCLAIKYFISVAYDFILYYIKEKNFYEVSREYKIIQRTFFSQLEHFLSRKNVYETVSEFSHIIPMYYRYLLF